VGARETVEAVARRFFLELRDDGPLGLLRGLPRPEVVSIGSKPGVSYVDAARGVAVATCLVEESAYSLAVVSGQPLTRRESALFGRVLSSVAERCP
jgi:hypothetical protein